MKVKKKIKTNISKKVFLRTCVISGLSLHFNFKVLKNMPQSYQLMRLNLFFWKFLFLKKTRWMHSSCPNVGVDVNLGCLGIVLTSLSEKKKNS